MLDETFEPTKRAVDRALEIMAKMLFPALLEGGLNVGAVCEYPRIITNTPDQSRHVFRLIHRGDERLFTLSCGIPPAESLVRPKVLQVNASVEIEPRGTPKLLFSRRTNGPWQVCAFGTLSLPRGHALGDLAHDSAHLGLEPKRMSRDIPDDREAFRHLARLGRLVHTGHL
ncbi:hypothetical protein EDM68_00330 [Candidatus Uhrbacteria bacterium]|nr:MAG: hypothetical protein EDM68_00330 [Candidatus Uhrbacteria bacterium]